MLESKTTAFIGSLSITVGSRLRVCGPLHQPPQLNSILCFSFHSYHRQLANIFDVVAQSYFLLLWLLHSYVVTDAFDSQFLHFAHHFYTTSPTEVLPMSILDQPSVAIHLQERRSFPTFGISKSNLREIKREFKKSYSYVWSLQSTAISIYSGSTNSGTGLGNLLTTNRISYHWTAKSTEVCHTKSMQFLLNKDNNRDMRQLNLEARAIQI